MTIVTATGRVLSETDIERIVAKAEAGFDLSEWRPRVGRPYLSASEMEHSPRIAIRLPRHLRDAAIRQASVEGKSLSQVVRDLLEEYVRSRDRR